MIVVALFQLLITISQGWQLEVVDSTGGQCSSISIDSNNNPHIAYGAFGCSVKHAYSDGDSWTSEIVSEYPYYGAYDVSMVLDPTGTPHITYIRRGGGYPEIGILMYSYWNGSSWETSCVDEDENGGYRSSIALDSSGNPHIAYDNQEYFAVKYASWNGSSWEIETVESGASDPSLVIDSNDIPHIVYRSSNNLRYAILDGSVWEHETVSQSGVGHTALVLDSFDYPHIAFQSNMDLHYAFWNGSAWEASIVDSIGQTGAFASIDLDSANNPHMVYQNTNYQSLEYAYWTGMEWVLETIESGFGSGFNTSLALNSSDKPNISFMHSQPATPGLSFTCNDDSGISQSSDGDQSDFILHRISPNPTTVSAIVRVSLVEPLSLQLFLYDISGHLVRSFGELHFNSGNHSIQTGELEEGLYFCRAVSGKTESIQKFVVIE